MVYLASHVGETSCGLRIDREGHDKLTGALLPSPEAIIANAQGLIGVANCHFQKIHRHLDRRMGAPAKQSEFSDRRLTWASTRQAMSRPERAATSTGWISTAAASCASARPGKSSRSSTLPPKQRHQGAGRAIFASARAAHAFSIQYRYNGAWRAIGFDGSAGAELKVQHQPLSGRSQPARRCTYCPTPAGHRSLFSGWKASKANRAGQKRSHAGRRASGSTQWGIFGNEVILRRADPRELFSGLRSDDRRIQAGSRHPPRTPDRHARQPGLERGAESFVSDFLSWTRSRGPPALAHLAASIRIDRLPRVGAGR